MVEVYVQNERFIAVCSCCLLNLQFAVRSLRQRNLLKWVPYVQHDYFHSTNHITIQPIISLFSGGVVAETPI